MDVTCASLGPVLSVRHDEIVAASGSRSVFLTADFLQPWLDVFGPHHEIVNLAVHRRGELIGLAPLAIRTEPGWPSLRRLVVAGQYPTSGEYLDVVAVAGAEQAVADAVAAQLTGPLASRWDVLTFQRVLADSPVMGGLARAMAFRGCPLQFLPAGVSPFMTLPPADQPLLRGKSKNFRDQVKQARNRVGKLGSVRLAVVGDDLSLDEGFTHLLRLHRSRWVGESSFDTPDKLRFHRLVAERLAARDRLYLALLLVDDEAVAARHDFVFDNKMWCIQGGWDPAHASARPGLFMTEAAMAWAAVRGLREYDFLGGEGEYKQRWSTGSRDLVTVVAHNRSTLRGRSYPRLQTARTRLHQAATAIRRQARGSSSPASTKAATSSSRS